uniref:Uncharacterized protein n=1 Tax=Timema monikensis TaxID=170555 RepID=A0A7R9HJK2_9NEOP|nr:unnamed protein product [Timema monikensis]
MATETMQIAPRNERAKFARTLTNDIAAQAAAIIASQPFNVIAVRMMAQFVGAEKIYSGVLSSIGHIYHEEGLLGFFSGLMPRLLGELVALVISSTITYFINSYIISDRELHTYTMATSRPSPYGPVRVVDRLLVTPLTDQSVEARLKYAMAILYRTTGCHSRPCYAGQHRQLLQAVVEKSSLHNIVIKYDIKKEAAIGHDGELNLGPAEILGLTIRFLHLQSSLGFGLFTAVGGVENYKELVGAIDTADPTFDIQNSINILIGADFFANAFTGDRHTICPSLLVAVGSIFGYVIMGTTPFLQLSHNNKRNDFGEQWINEVSDFIITNLEEDSSDNAYCKNNVGDDGDNMRGVEDFEDIYVTTLLHRYYEIPRDEGTLTITGPGIDSPAGVNPLDHMLTRSLSLSEPTTHPYSIAAKQQPRVFFLHISQVDPSSHDSKINYYQHSDSTLYSLIRADVMEELVLLTTLEPPEDVEERLRYKYPNIACELMTCDVPAINERLARDEALLGKLYAFLDSDKPLNPLLASFFSKTIGVLVARRSEQINMVPEGAKKKALSSRATTSI